MSARVFISCGQATSAERKAAAAVKQWFHKRGFDVYVAIQAQSQVSVTVFNYLYALDSPYGA